MDDIEAAFTGHPGVKRLNLVDSVIDEYLLRVEWDPEYEGVLSTLADTQVPLIEVVGTEREWTFEIRGDNRSDIAEFQRLCHERNISITMTAIRVLTPLETMAVSVLTEAQQEAIFLAYDRGYFNLPREVTMEELGEELGISHQAVASRIRRGLRRILSNTLTAVSGNRQV